MATSIGRWAKINPVIPSASPFLFRLTYIEKIKPIPRARIPCDTVFIIDPVLFSIFDSEFKKSCKKPVTVLLIPSKSRL